MIPPKSKEKVKKLEKEKESKEDTKQYLE